MKKGENVLKEIIQTSLMHVEIFIQYIFMLHECIIILVLMLTGLDLLGLGHYRKSRRWIRGSSVISPDCIDR